MFNKTKKRMVLPTMLTLGVIMLGLLSVSYASAQENNNYPEIVQKLAQRFNLNESDVEAVFDEEREDHFADMQARWQERLDDLVNEGKITAEQKTAIVAKHEEMHGQMIELQSLSRQDRQDKMQEIHDSFKTWADEQGIDLPMFGAFGKGNGMGRVEMSRGEMHRGYMMNRN